MEDARALLALQAELLQLPPLSPAWQQHLLHRLRRLVPAKLACFQELHSFIPRRWPFAPRGAAVGDLDDAGWRDFAAYAAKCNELSRLDTARRRRGEPIHAVPELLENTPPMLSPFFHALSSLNGRLFTHRREEVTSDDEWYASPLMQRHLSVSELDDCVITLRRLDGEGRIVGFALYRDQGDRRRFSPRERAILHLLHEAIEHCYERALARPHLSPRLAQTLDLLLEGLAEKQIARRLGISIHTVHEYVTDLYRRHGVSGRSELLIRVLGGSARTGNGAGSPLPSNRGPGDSPPHDRG
ncbi:MAG: helix-turn-helix transcriptional regulator [Phycisphaeraceae bacterium]|nr:helix-turn-helix transcriptional regulator [Phycisphaerales bacterium]QOJ18509.1 MAG: helix-turn-helix transcriptional regulator [Phycisphaeraceae bacterium]